MPELEYTNMFLSNEMETKFSRIILILAVLVLLKVVCGLVQATRQSYKKSMCMSEQKVRFQKVKGNEYLSMKEDSSEDKAANSALKEETEEQFNGTRFH